MTVRGFVSIVALAALIFATSVQDLRAAGPMGQAGTVPSKMAAFHATTTAELHQAAHASYKQGREARKSVEEFLARPEVRNQIQHLGIAPERLTSQIAKLSEADILRLSDQMMAADMQKAPAGLSTTAIVLIIVAAAVGTGILIWLLSDEDVLQ